MKRRCLLLSALILAVGCSSDKEEHKTILGSPWVVGVTNDSPGFSTGTTRQSGFEVDLAHSLALKLNVQYTPSTINSGDRESFLKNGNGNFVIANFSMTPDRNKKGIDFAGPYIKTPQALLVRADDEREYTDKSSVRGKSICTEEGTTGNGVDIPLANMDSPKSTTKECVDALNSKNTNAVFTDALILYGYAAANPGKYRVVLFNVFGRMQYYGVGIRRGHHDDCEKINDAIRDFLNGNNNQWRTAFRTHFEDLTKKFTGSDPAVGDFESMFKPTEADMDDRSCKL